MIAILLERGEAEVVALPEHIEIEALGPTRG
jgi:hypothetical protein